MDSAWEGAIPFKPSSHVPDETPGTAGRAGYNRGLQLQFSW